MDFPVDKAYLARIDDADIIFVAQDGYKLAPARVRCYSFAKLLRRYGLRCEVLSFFDHLGASAQGGPVFSVPEEEKLRLNLAAYEVLSRNPRAILYVQKCGYHAIACMLAAARNGNKLILDYDDYDLEGQPFRRLESWLPSLKPDQLFEQVARQAAACIASSRRIRDLMAPLNANTHLVHTVADQDLFSTEGRRQPRHRFGDAVNILWGGDVWGDIPMKDIVFGVDAFALVPNRIRRKARFHIIGFGRAWEELKRRVRMRYPDMDNLVFHEHIPPSEFGAVLAEMDIGVLPYANNQFNAAKSPTKMFEYMLSKVAVCATPVGEVAHCLEDGKSVLLGDGMEAFSRQLARLIDDEDLRGAIADAAHAQALVEYSLQGVGERLSAILRSVIASPPPTAEVTVEEAMAHALGRRLRIAPREALLARRDLRALIAAPDFTAADPRRWSAPLLALLEWPGLADAEKIGADRLDSVRRAAVANRLSARLRPLITLPASERPAGPPALSKLAAAEDWEDPDWFAWAQRYKASIGDFPANDANGIEDVQQVMDDDRLNHTYSYFKRSRGWWERVQFLYGLDRLGHLRSGASILVVSPNVDGFYLFLTEWAERVDVLDIGDDAQTRAAQVAAGETEPWLLKARLFHRDRIHVHRGGTGDPALAGSCWDAIVIVQNGVARADTAMLFSWAAGRLSPGGTLAFSMEIRLAEGGAGQGSPRIRGIDAAAIPDIATAISRTGLEPLEPFDRSLSDATLDRAVTAGTPDAANPHFIMRTNDVLHMPAVWFCRNPLTPQPGASIGAWTQVAAAIR